jgi:uncharacterized membrane protein YhaH (DUF805 family)
MGLSTSIAQQRFGPLSQLPVVVVLGPACCWLLWSVTFRRLHDLGRSAVDVFKFLVPGLNIMIFMQIMTWEGQAEANAYGPRPTFFGLGDGSAERDDRPSGSEGTAS